MKIKDSSEFIKMQNEESYSFDAFLYAKQKTCFKIMRKVSHLPFDSKRREKLLRKALKKLGNKTVIKEGFTCNFGFNISIGDNCFINHNVTILDSYEVEIGNNVFIGPGVIISPVTHPNEYRNRRNLIGKKITIEDNAWIGSNAVILPGVKLGKGSVVGAGTVVKKDVLENEVVGGVPAKHIKFVDNKGE